jgi:hypothetical protein
MKSQGGGRNFLRRFAWIVAGILVLTVSINLFVDPWDRFGLNRLGVYISASREFKLTEAKRFPHDALLLGNSRAAMLPVASLAGGRFFNAAFEGANLAEIRLFLERNLQGQKLVLLNLDPFTLGSESDRIPTEAFDPVGPKMLGSYLASLKALEYSAKTITSRIAGKTGSYLPDGTTASDEWKAQRDVDDEAWQRSQRNSQIERLAAFRFDPRRVEELRGIDSLVRERGAELLPYLSPVEEDILPGLETGAAATEWSNAVNAVRAIVPGVVDLTHSALSARTNFYKTDPVHFYPEIGVRFLNEKVLPLAAQSR